LLSRHLIGQAIYETVRSCVCTGSGGRLEVKHRNVAAVALVRSAVADWGSPGAIHARRRASLAASTRDRAAAAAAVRLENAAVVDVAARPAAGTAAAAAAAGGSDAEESSGPVGAAVVAAAAASAESNVAPTAAASAASSAAASRRAAAAAKAATASSRARARGLRSGSDGFVAAGADPFAHRARPRAPGGKVGGGRRGTARMCIGARGVWLRVLMARVRFSAGELL